MKTAQCNNLRICLVIGFGILCSGTLQAQPYQITFTGSGLSSSVATVEVMNLTQGTSLTLNGSDILRLVSNVGTFEDAYTKCSLLIYPNPVESSSRVELFSAQPEYVSIMILDAQGKQLLRNEFVLVSGTNVFDIGGLKSGVYSIRVNTASGAQAGQFVSVGEQEGLPFLRSSGMTTLTNLQARETYISGIVTMNYLAGERLLFKGKSGNYSRVLTIVPTQSQSVNFEFIACTDGDGNDYPVVTVGTQTWMAENLKTTKFIDGTSIYLETSNSSWGSLTQPAYCWYANDYGTYGTTYGALYNGFAAISDKICPNGWHIPTDSEWAVLVNYLGGNAAAQGKLKETGTLHWQSPNALATNEVGFTALAGGKRDTPGYYDWVTWIAIWWSSSQCSNNSNWSWGLDQSNVPAGHGCVTLDEGFSLRCVKN